MRHLSPTSMTTKELINHLDIEVVTDTVSPQYVEEFLKRTREFMNLQTEKATNKKDDSQLPLF